MGPGKGVLSYGREENYVRAHYDTVRYFESKERLAIAYALRHLVAHCSFSTPLLCVPRSLKTNDSVFWSRTVFKIRSRWFGHVQRMGEGRAVA